MAKSKTLIVVLGALALGASLGYFAGRGQSGEAYSVPLSNRCGPDALSAALSEFNIEAPAGKIASLARTDSHGTSMLGLKDAAEALGAKAVGLRISQKELESYVHRGAEVIAFVNGDHYVWVKEIHPKGMVVKDGSPGFQFVPYERWYPMWFENRGGETPAADKGRGVCLVVYPKADSQI